MRQKITTFCIFLIGILGIAALAQGPLTPFANLAVRTDGAGSLITSYVAFSGSAGPLTPFANLRGRTDSNGYLLTTAGSGTFTPDKICFDSTNQDVCIWRTGAKAGQIDTDAAGGALNSLTVKGPLITSDSFRGPGSPLASSGDIRLQNGGFIIARNAANSGDATVIGMTASNEAEVGDTVTNTFIGNIISRYKALATAGNGVSSIYGYGDTVAATNTGTASIATFTPSVDGTFQVGCNVLITTSTTHSFSCDVTYTDEGNVARTMVLPVVQLAGTFVTTGLITNVTGTGPYESPTMTIRVKASTAITVRTSSGGTFTGVVYNARGYIAKVG